MAWLCIGDASWLDNWTETRELRDPYDVIALADCARDAGVILKMPLKHAKQLLNKDGTDWESWRYQRDAICAQWPADPLDAGTRRGSASTKRRPGAPSTKLEAAKAALRERYPNGVPPRQDSNAAIAAQIQEDLSAKGLPTVSARTIDTARRALEDAQK